MILEPVQVGRIAFLEFAVGKAEALCSRVPSLDQVARDVDAQDRRPERRGRHGRRPVAAADVENLESGCNAQTGHQGFAAFAHALCDAREVPFSQSALFGLTIVDTVASVLCRLTFAGAWRRRHIYIPMAW